MSPRQPSLHVALVYDGTYPYLHGAEYGLCGVIALSVHPEPTLIEQFESALHRITDYQRTWPDGTFFVATAAEDYHHDPCD